MDAKAIEREVIVIQFNTLVDQARKRAVFLGVIVAMVMIAPVVQAQLLFTPPQKLSSNSASSHFAGEQLIAVDALGNINIVWLESTNSANVMFSRSIDGGLTFSTPINLSNNPSGAIGPSLALDASGNIYVAWSGVANFANGATAIFFTRSTDGGSTFSTPVNVSGPQPAVGASGQSMILDSGGNVYLVWSGSFDNNSLTYGPVFFSLSSDGGATFSPPVQVSNDQTQRAQVAVDASGNIDVVWYESVNGGGGHDPVFFSQSSDRGATFSTPITVSGDTFFPPEQQMTVDSQGNIYVVENLDPTQNGVDRDVWLAYSSDGGTTFSMTNISNNPGSNGPTQGQIALDSAGNVNVVWVEPTQLQIFYRRSTDGGATFSDPVNVSNDSFGYIENPQIIADPGGNINVVWDQNTGQFFDILFSRSSDGGSTFSSPQNISHDQGNSVTPVMAVDSLADAYFVWRDDSPHQNPPVWNIFFSRDVSFPVLNLNRKHRLPPARLR
ncbi:MAG TPA: sialidase family protein [Terriglobales bacterium]|nr:sialidase family protein [Terriglobales bacterium]